MPGLSRDEVREVGERRRRTSNDARVRRTRAKLLDPDRNPYLRPLGEILESQKRSESYERIVGRDRDDRPASDYLIAALSDALEHARYVRDHACEWDESDYCRVCRADGRA